MNQLGLVTGQLLPLQRALGVLPNTAHMPLRLYPRLITTTTLSLSTILREARTTDHRKTRRRGTCRKWAVA